MTQIKSSRKIIDSNIQVSIKSIKFNSDHMSNKISWELSNPSNENVQKIKIIIYQNDTSVEKGRVLFSTDLNKNAREYTHRKLEVVNKKGNYMIYAYQVIAITDITTKASDIEKFDVREIYECKPPEQVTFTVKNDGIYFSIKCKNSKFSTNIFVFRKDYQEDTFERIAVLTYSDQLYVDPTAILGHFYEYRFFSFDIFKHFSQDIVKINVFTWTHDMHTSKNSTLLDPVPYAEFASEASVPIIKLRVSNLDERCKWYYIKRRDLSEHQRDFKEVEQWSNYSGSVFFNNGTTEFTFFDYVIHDGAYYQYSAMGLSISGENSDTRLSNIVYAGALTNELPASPINISGSILQEYPTGVTLSWTDNNLNQVVSDIVSGSSPLFPRTNQFYFKVFRRRNDELNYQSFPEQSESFITDMCDDDGAFRVKESPYYRPSPPVRDQKYFYHVVTYDINGVESNRSPDVFVDLTIPPGPIKNLEASFNDVIEPLKCILTWNIDENEKTLDSFIVERLESKKGIWEKIGRSYFTEQFIDTTIERGNKYAYRIRAADFMENMSPYSMCAMEVK